MWARSRERGTSAGVLRASPGSLMMIAVASARVFSNFCTNSARCKSLSPGDRERFLAEKSRSRPGGRFALKQGHTGQT